MPRRLATLLAAGAPTAAVAPTPAPPAGPRPGAAAAPPSPAPPATAATSAACTGGAYTVTLPGGRILAPGATAKLSPSQLGGGRLHVQGRYTQFDVDARTL